MRLALLLFLPLYLLANQLHAQGLNARGREFWLVFGDNGFQGGSPSPVDKVSVFVSSRVNTTGRIDAPAGTWTQNFTVNAGVPTEILVPFNLVMGSVSNVNRNVGLRITTRDSVNVYALNYRINSADASIVLPAHALRDDYVVLSYNERAPSENVGVSQFNIVALQNNTEIEIIPSANIANGNNARQRYTIRLNAGQAYQAQGRRDGVDDLTGTIIRSANREDCKPFAVFGGNRCSNVGDCGRCDHLFEQLFPVSTWGLEYITVPFRNRRDGDIIRILAAEDDTEIELSDATRFTLQAGRYRDVRRQDPIHIRATRPIMVAQFARGGCCDAGFDTRDCYSDPGNFVYGDPFMLLVSPLEQMTIRSTTINSFRLDNIDDNFINIITPTTAVNSFRIDGNTVANEFRPVPGRPEYSYARLSVRQGDHTLTSGVGFISYVYGFGTRDSYGYSGDITLSNLRLRIQAESTSCTGQPVTFRGESSRQVTGWQWHTSDGQRQVGQSATFSFARAGTYYVTLVVQDASTSCGVDSSVHEINVFGPELTLLESRAASCARRDGLIRVEGRNGQPPYRYRLNGGQPQPSGLFQNLASGRYTVMLEDNSRCTNQLVVDLTSEQNLSLQVIEKRNATCTAGGVLEVRGTSPTNVPIRYTWSNGSATARLTDLAPGTYSVTAVDQDGCESILENLEIGLENNLVVSIQAQAPLLLCPGARIPLQGIIAPADASPLRVQWLRNGQAIANATAPAYVATEAGSYTLRANWGRCEATATAIQIQQGQVPPADLTSTKPISEEGGAFICSNESIILTAPRQPGLTYRWFVNGQPTEARDASLTISQPGVYWVVVSNGTCEKQSIEVRVLPARLPLIRVRVDGGLVLCNNSSITFTAEAEPDVSYRWLRNGQQVSNQPIYTTNQPGNYQLVATRDGCENRSEVYTVTVVNVLEPRITTPAARLTACEGETVHLTAEVMEGQQLQWFRNGQPVEGAREASLFATSGGFYRLRATIGNCSAFSDSVAVTFLPNQSTPIVAPVPAEFCEGSTLTLATSPLPAVRYRWIYQDEVFRITEQPELQVDRPGLWSVQYFSPASSAAACFIPSQKVEVILRSRPSGRILSLQDDLAFCSNADLTLLAEQQGASNYTWFRNGQPYLSGPEGRLRITESGSYRLQVFDGLCESEIGEPVRVRLFPAPPATVVPAGPVELCPGQPIELASVPTPPRTRYEWRRDNQFISGANFAELAVDQPGSYTLITSLIFEVDTATGQSIVCQRTSEPVVVLPPRLSSIRLRSSTSLIACEGGLVRFFVDDVADARYQWLRNGRPIPEATGSAYEAREAGFFSVRIEAGSCSIETSALPTLFLQRPVIDQVITRPVRCHGQSSGLAAVDVRGGLFPYRYRWSNGASDAVNPNLSAGLYSLTVTDERGCRVVRDSIRITQPESLLVRVDSTRAALCPTSPDGAIYTSTSGGVEPYTWTWSNEARTPNLVGVRGGSYSLLVLDANGCAAILNNLSIPRPESIRPVLTQLLNNRCFGDTLGVVAFTAFGGTGPYVYSRDGTTWDSTARYTGLRGRDNVFYIRDARGCIHEFDSGLRDPDSLYVKIYKTNETCPNSANGNIVLEGVGGIAPYNYYLNEYKNIHGIYPFLQPDKYEPRIVDKNGCEFVADTVIVEPASGTQIESDFVARGTARIESPACATLTEGLGNFQNAAIWNRKQLNLNSGFDFSFDLEFGDNPDGADGIVFVLQGIGTDALGLSGGGMGYADMPNSVGIEFDIFSNSYDPECDHIAINLNGKLSEPVAGPVDASPTQCSIKDGRAYRARITWVPASRTLEVYFDGELRLSHSIDLIGLAFRGNPNVWWGFTAATGGKAARQRVCMQNTQVVCDCRPFEPIVQTTGYYEICRGQSVTFTAPAGFASYLWSNGERSQSIVATETDTYYVSVGDSTGCGGSSRISTVIVHPRPTLQVTRVDQIFGDGFAGAISATASGGTPPYVFTLVSDQVNFSGPTAEYTDLQDGVYVLTVTDRNGCQDTRTIVIQEPPMLCKNPNRLKVESVTETSATISWEKVPRNATGYIVAWYSQRQGRWLEQPITDPDRTTVSIFDLVPGTDYRVRVRTVCGAGVSLFSPDSSFRTPKACPRPVDVTIVPGPFAIDVNWREVRDALSYKIGWRVPSAGGAWFEATVPADRPSYRILGLDSMTAVDLRIRTVCRLDDASVWSGPFSTATTDPDACLEPANSEITNLTNRSARLVWEAVPRAQQYEINLRRKGQGDGQWQVFLTRDLSVDFEDLEPNILYEYRLRTVCSAVRSSDFLPVREFRTVNRTCVQPSDLRIQMSLTHADLSWRVESQVEAFDISWRRIDAPGPWVRVRLEAAAQYHYRVANLFPETPYEFRVQAVCTENSIGAPARDTASTLPTSTCPAPPGIQTEQIGSNQLRLSWLPVAPALRYRVGYALLGQPQLLFQEVTQTSLLIGGLQPLGQYRIQVQSICSDGLVSLPSPLDTVPLRSGNCLPPRLVQVTSGREELALRWASAPAAQGYILRWRQQGLGSAMTEVRIGDPAQLNATLSGLNPATFYEIRLATQCAGEFSTWVDTVLATQYNENDPDCITPPAVQVVDITDFSAVLQWVALPNALYYEVRWLPAGSTEWNVDTTSGTRYSLRGLRPNVIYAYQVRAYCSEGRRTSWTISRSFRTTLECPAPRNVSILTGSRVAVLSWDHVLQAVGYRVLWRPRQGNASWDAAQISSLTTNSIQLINLLPLTEYEFRIVTLCDPITSPFTEGRFSTGSAPVEPQPCPAPANPRVSNITRQSFTLSWNAAAGAVDYEVQYRATKQTAWTTLFTNQVQISIGGLTPLTEYEARVRTRCAGTVVSTYAAVSAFSTAGLCDTPTNLLLARAFTNRLVVSWNLMTSATGYTVGWRLAGSSVNWTTVNINAPTTNSYTITNLQSGRSYEVRVQAVCGVDRSAWTQPLEARTLTSREGFEPHGDRPQVVVYPNPNRGRFTVQWAGFGEGPVELVLIDVRGRELLRWTASETEPMLAVDASGFAAGLYVLRIYSATHQLQQRLLIE